MYFLKDENENYETMSSEDKEKKLKILSDEMCRLKDIDFDFEYAHLDADDILCDFLLILGYKEIVDDYRKVGKWYA